MKHIIPFWREVKKDSIKMIKKIFYYYSDLNGKADRTEYGIYLFLDSVAVFFALYLYDKMSFNNHTIIYLFYTWLILLFAFIPIHAVSTRRLRHIGVNTGFIIFNFVPIVNLFFRLFLLIKKGKPAIR